MDIRRIELFVTLVESGGFRQAAEQLFISQPALSQQIARLETSIGLRLVDRSTRPITMTAAGREFYFQCRRILEAVGEAENLLDGARNATIGRLRIGVVPAMLFSTPPLVIRSFQKANPGLDITLKHLTTTQLIEELETGNLDVVVLLTQPEAKGMQSVSLFSEKYQICLPADHPLADQQQITFAELKGERFILVSRPGSPENFDATVAACMRAGFSPRGHSTAGSFLDHACMVAAGMGVCLIPESLTRHKIEGTVYRPLIDPTVELTASLTWYEQRRDAALTSFVEHFTAAYASRTETLDSDVTMKGNT